MIELDRKERDKMEYKEPRSQGVLTSFEHLGTFGKLRSNAPRI